MCTVLCEKCALLFCKFKLRFRNICKEIAHEIAEFFSQLAECNCLSRTPPRRRQRSASDHLLLPLLKTGDHALVLNEECFEALNDLAASVYADLQEAAALYYLYLSHCLESPLPASFMGPLMSLLFSPHPDVQKTTCLSLVNLLVKRNVCEELAFEMGVLPPLLEIVQAGDPGARCHACACVTMLASSESNSDALVSEGVIPLLVLAKSFDPQVQQNAAWVLLNLTQSVRSRRVLCRAGAVPVLVVLLQCADSRVQFYGCSALLHLAADPEHHARLLHIGERYLLKALLTLMASPVSKNACQACKCLEMLCRNVAVQDQLLELDCVRPLKTLLSSPVLQCVQSALTLLSALATHPAFHEVLVSEGVCDLMGPMLRRHGSSCDVIMQSCASVLSLGGSCLGRQALMESECLPGLLQALVSPGTPVKALIRLTSCLHRLMSFEALQSHLSIMMTSEEVLRLVKSSGPNGNLQLTYNCIAILSTLQMNGQVIGLLRPHYRLLMGIIVSLFKNQELKFQHLGITALCNLIQDADFRAVLSGSELETEVLRLSERTEETRQLLSLTGIPPASPQEP
ncbi:uncharacterized protein LOC132457564 [Gadus macrocephalus]|uniref:uncharacterized protein LOC132457564 n=1 Tax=Gadus macrocephalus TaxID=80720 RepID=UPI0028CB3681|nr:uncharacterized protein LOC132457564 [Gadus macrocephalus]